MRALERDILAAADRVASASAAGPAPAPAGAKDPASAARTGLERLRREILELEAIAEEQARPSDRAATLDALAERVASRDAVRDILRDAVLRAAAPPERRGPAESDAAAARDTARRRTEAEERDALLTVDDEAEAASSAGGQGAVAAATEATASLRRARAAMAEELEKGRATLAAMAESRATLKKTGDEYEGDQSAALGSGDRLIAKLERAAKLERLVLWVGFACFCLAAAHVILKRTPVLVRFHPLWWIRKRALKAAKEAARAKEVGFVVPEEVRGEGVPAGVLEAAGEEDGDAAKAAALARDGVAFDEDGGAPTVEVGAYAIGGDEARGGGRDVGEL